MLRGKGVAAAWRVLGLKQGATWEEAKARHRELAVAHHPDKGGCPEKMQDINAAFAAVREWQREGAAAAPAASAEPRSAGRMKEQREGMAEGGEKPAAAHTVFNYTRTRIQPQRAGADVADAQKKRAFATLLRSPTMRGSDAHGPKLQAKNPTHWGRVYGRVGRAGTVDEKAARWGKQAGDDDL